MLNHVHKLTAGTLTGVSGAGVEIAGLRLPRRWWRRFTRRSSPTPAQRLVKRRWSVLALGPPGPRSCSGGLLWWRAVRIGEPTRRSSTRCRRGRWPGWSPWPSSPSAWRLLKRIRSRAQRPTPHGLVRAEHWMCVRAWMEPRGFEGASPAPPTAPSRALAYAAALGLADRAADELPIVPEDDRLAWSNATGEWHVVRVRYPFRPGYGRHPALMLAVGLVGRRGALRPAAVPARVARGDALSGHRRGLPRPGRPDPGRRPRARRDA